MIFHTPQRLVCLVCVSGHVVWHNSVSAVLPLVHMEWSSWSHKGFLTFCILLSWFHLQLVATWYPDLFYLYWRCFYAVRKYVSHNFLTWHHPLDLHIGKPFTALYFAVLLVIRAVQWCHLKEKLILFLYTSQQFSLLHWASSLPEWETD